MNEKETRLRKMEGKANGWLGISVLVATVLLSVTSTMLIVISQTNEVIDLWSLILGILGLCNCVGFIIIVGVGIAVDHKIKNEVKRREENAKNNKEKLNELLQTDEIIEQREQAK